MSGDNKMYVAIAYAVMLGFACFVGGLVRGCDNSAKVQIECFKAGRPGPECKLVGGQ